MKKNQFNEYIKNILSDDEWLVVENEYNNNKNLEFETKFTVSNGKISMRASHFEAFSNKALPATYMHRIFDKDRAFQRELVNLPNPNILKIYFKTDPIALETGKNIDEYIRILDMKKGVVVKKYIFTSYNGNKTRIESIHFANRNDNNNINIRVYLTPLNYSGKVEFENIIDGTITNFIDFPRFRVKHYNVLETGSFKEDGIYLIAETKDSKIKTIVSSKILVHNETTKYVNKSYSEYGVEFFDLDVKENKTYCIDKKIVIASQFDTDNLILFSEEKLNNLDFEIELNNHVVKYSNLWKRAYIKIEGDSELQKAIRFNIFHLMSTPSLDSSHSNIGAKMMHGEEYGGHTFWDTEIFILPFFVNVFPEIAKNLVEYRYNMLEGALRNAKKFGYLGARFPWESADTGDEECPDWTIEPDGTCYRCTVAKEEIHVTSDVIYGGYNYYLRTKDEEYFIKFKEMLNLTSEYWCDRLELNGKYYELTGVTGPDEWHENIKNNFYTNFIVKWHLELAYKLLNNNKYYEISKKIKLPKIDGIIEQFEGYFKLEDEEIYEYDKNNMPLFPKKIKNIPRYLTTINKQADVIMAMYLFPEFFDLEIQKINYEYYEKRTLHRSSLSPSIFCLMGLRLGYYSNAYDYLLRSAFVDIHNNQGNIREGMHAASAGGTWQALVFGYLGLQIKQDKIILNPKLMNNWKEVQVNIVLNNKLNKITVNKNGVNIVEEELECL